MRHHTVTMPQDSVRQLFSQSSVVQYHLAETGPVALPFALIDDGDAGVIVSVAANHAPLLRMAFEVRGDTMRGSNVRTESPQRWYTQAHAVVELLQPRSHDPRFDMACQALGDRFGRDEELVFAGPLLWGTITDWIGWAHV